MSAKISSTALLPPPFERSRLHVVELESGFVPRPPSPGGTSTRRPRFATAASAACRRWRWCPRRSAGRWCVVTACSATMPGCAHQQLAGADEQRVPDRLRRDVAIEQLDDLFAASSSLAWRSVASISSGRGRDRACLSQPIGRGSLSPARRSAARARSAVVVALGRVVALVRQAARRPASAAPARHVASRCS